jgi:hypothetical protein
MIQIPHRTIANTIKPNIISSTRHERGSIPPQAACPIAQRIFVMNEKQNEEIKKPEVTHQTEGKDSPLPLSLKVEKVGLKVGIRAAIHDAAE